MKKLAIGCGIAVLVIGAVVVGAGYYVYGKARATYAQLAQFGRVHDIERGVKVQTPFVVPSSGQLTQAQVDKMMKVTSRVRERLDKDMANFQSTYKMLADKANKNQTTAADLPALLSAYRDLAADWIEAKRTQVDALNEVGLSLQEYRWIRSAAYGALDIPFVDVDMGRIADQVKSGGTPNSYALVGGAFAGKGPESNGMLVSPYRKQLEDYMPLAAFGL
jgi:hypothetical protein